MKQTILSNGITVMSESIPTVRSISLGLWYRVGARDERANQAGLTHFMEHMMFKGTPSYSALDISAAFDRLGADLNAFTSKEYTCYYIRLVDEKLPEAFPILADMVCNSSFTDETIQPEREVVLEEIARSEDTPDDYVFDLYMEAALPTQALGRPVLGSREAVSSYKHYDCELFHQEHYLGSNLIVCAVGHLAHDQLVKLVERHLSELPRGEATRRTPTDEHARGRLIAQTKETEQAHLVYGFPWIDAKDPRRYAGAILSSILGGSMSSRLFQEVREKRGLAYAISAQSLLYTDHGQFSVYCGTRPDNLAEVVEIIHAELAKLAETPPLEEEIHRAKESICGQLLLSLESTSSRMLRMGRSEVMGLDYRDMDAIIALYNRVEASDIMELARDFLMLEPTMAVVSPLEMGALEQMFPQASS